MDKTQMIDYYIDQIIQTFPRTNDIPIKNNKVLDKDMPKYKVDTDYQFANTYLDIKNLEDPNHEFNINNEILKFVYELNSLRTKNISIRDNAIARRFTKYDKSDVSINIIIDTLNKTLEYKNLNTKEGKPIKLYREMYKLIEGKEIITKEKGKVEEHGNKTIITNTKSNVIYDNNRYRETTYEKDIIIRYGNNTEVEVLRIDDYMLSNGVRIYKRTTNNSIECFIFCKNNLDTIFKSKISSDDFDNLLKLKDDSYALENNELIYNLRNKRNKYL